VLNKAKLQMFNFTVHHNQQINKKILLDLDRISSIIIQQLPDVEALILVGGFGRGEGSVLIKNGTPQPINDYDVVIILKNKPSSFNFKKLAQTTANEINIRLIDFIPYLKNDLLQLKPTIFNYDLKYGGYVFYGNKKILNEIPRYKADEIPLIEGKILLFNRMVCLLESFSLNFKKRLLTQKEKFFLVNQTSKAILACCDSLLLLEGSYHHSYLERYKRFSKKFKQKNKKITSLVQRATNFKLRPRENINFDTIEYWFDVKEEFIKTLQQYLEVIYNKKFKDWANFAKTYNKKNVRFYLKKIRNKPKGINDKAHIKKNIELAEIFLLSSIENNFIINPTNIDRAKIVLKKITEKNYPNNNWEALRKECVNLWFQHLH
jgi:hypothetical protein